VPEERTPPHTHTPVTPAQAAARSRDAGAARAADRADAGATAVPGGSPHGSESGRDTGKPQRWTTLELVRFTTAYFSERGVASARLDAEVLLAHVLGCRRLDLYVQFDRPADPDERARYRALIRRRTDERVPVAYLIGEREFWSQRLRVTPDVLIPRPETEVLVRAVLDRLPAGPRRVADVGTGSGAIAAALALERPDLEIVAIDVSEAALAVAEENFRALGVHGRVAVCHAPLLETAPTPFDAIVSNPPYIPTATLAGLAPELHHEPRMALDGGADGLGVLRALAASACRSLRPSGLIAFEVGAGQAATVSGLLAAAGAVDHETVRDLAGVERVVCARAPALA
jgi:release factor glutamine methyltransferase